MTDKLEEEDRPLACGLHLMSPEKRKRMEEMLSKIDIFNDAPLPEKAKPAPSLDSELLTPSEQESFMKEIRESAREMDEILAAEEV